MTNQPTEPPKSLGRYELVHLIGQGGMGEVYLAKISGAAGFEKPCIVKTILPALLKDSQFLDRFHHEAKVLVHLVHSSIAQVYDMGEANGTYYMALEYVAGVDVAYLAEQARSQGQAIPVPVALYLGQKVAEGLGYAHRKTGPDGAPLGIVHRDVSPHNVMVSYEGEVKVIDFGLAKSAARSKYTLPSTVMGKLGYMSPEQARAETVDHRSDIYSLGVMVWELLAGRPMISHGTVGEMMAAMANPQVPALHQLRPEVDPAIDAVVRRALAPRAQDRYARSDDFARALNEQLLRSSSSLGAEEVGNFVKALCPEAFSAQRKLISRISGVRRPPSTPPGGGVAPISGVAREPEPMMGMEATSVRALHGIQDDGLGATVRPMATPLPGAVNPTATPLPGAMNPMATPLPGAVNPRASMSARQASSAQLAPAPAPAPVPAPAPAPAVSGQFAPAGGISKTKLVGAVAALLFVMIGVAGTTAYFMRGQGGATPGVAQGPGGEHPPHRPPPGAMHPPPPGAMHPPPPGAMHPPPPGAMHPPPPGATPPEAMAEGDSHPTPVVAASGSEDEAAEPAKGAVGPVAAAPAVEKKPGEGSSAPKSQAEPSRPKVPKEPKEPKDPKPSGVWLPVKQVLAVERKDHLYVVRGARKLGLKPPMELQVVGPELNGKRKVLGNARIAGVYPKPGGGGARLQLDAAAANASGDLFLALPGSLAESGSRASAPESEPAPAPTPAPEAAPAPPAPPKKLTVIVKQTGLLGMMNTGFLIRNLEPEPLSNCTATIERKRQFHFTTLIKGESKINESAFRADSDAPYLRRGLMRIECAEGRTEVQIRQ